MNRDDIIRMASEVGIEFDPRWGTCYTGNTQLVRFAELVAAAEREECAQVCEDMNADYDGQPVWALWIARVIRERGET